MSLKRVKEVKNERVREIEKRKREEARRSESVFGV
jgi:hypothetical protein